MYPTQTCTYANAESTAPETSNRVCTTGDSEPPRTVLAAIQSATEAARTDTVALFPPPPPLAPPSPPPPLLRLLCPTYEAGVSVFARVRKSWEPWRCRIDRSSRRRRWADYETRYYARACTFGRRRHLIDFETDRKRSAAQWFVFAALFIMCLRPLRTRPLVQGTYSYSVECMLSPYPRHTT